SAKGCRFDFCENTEFRLARCAGRHKKSHCLSGCDQSRSQIDLSDRYYRHETPKYPTRVSPLSADRRRDRCGAHTQRSLFMSVMIGSDVLIGTLADIDHLPIDVRYWGQSGHAVLQRACMTQSG